MERLAPTVLDQAGDDGPDLRGTADHGDYAHRASTLRDGNRDKAPVPHPALARLRQVGYRRPVESGGKSARPAHPAVPYLLLAPAPLLPIAGGELWRQRGLTKSRWKTIATLGFLSFFLYQALFYAALTATTALNVLLISASTPPAVALLGWAAFREPVSLRLGAGIALSLLGVLVVITRGDPRALTGLAFNAGDRTVFDLPNILGVAYIGIFAFVLAYLFCNQGVATVGAGRAGLFMNLMPVFGAVLAVTFLGESFALYHLAGAVLVLGGIAPGSFRRRGS